MEDPYGKKSCWASPEGYINAHFQCYSDLFNIPLIEATEKTLEPFGRIVQDFDSEKVEIETWPKNEGRQIIPGTGRGAGVLHEEFRVFWDQDLVRVEEIPPDPNEKLVAGRLPKHVSQENRSHVLVRDFTAHPDGGQVFYPKTPEPFIQVLGPPGDNVKPSDMVAFYFDGSFALQFKANVWHQFPHLVQQGFRLSTCCTSSHQLQHVV